MMNIEKRFADLQILIDEFKRSGLRELQARHGDFEIYLSHDANASGLSGNAQAPTLPVQQAREVAPAVSAAPITKAAADKQATPAGATIVCAPYLGTFYRSPKPGSPPYVDIGSVVAADSELCLVEVMKLFTAVRAGVAGKVVQILASDGELVAANQPLFAVMPE